MAKFHPPLQIQSPAPICTHLLAQMVKGYNIDLLVIFISSKIITSATSLISQWKERTPVSTPVGGRSSENSAHTLSRCEFRAQLQLRKEHSCSPSKETEHSIEHMLLIIYSCMLIAPVVCNQLNISLTPIPRLDHFSSIMQFR